MKTASEKIRNGEVFMCMSSCGYSKDGYCTISQTIYKEMGCPYEKELYR